MVRPGAPSAPVRREQPIGDEAARRPAARQRCLGAATLRRSVIAANRGPRRAPAPAPAGRHRVRPAGAPDAAGPQHHAIEAAIEHDVDGSRRSTATRQRARSPARRARCVASPSTSARAPRTMPAEPSEPRRVRRERPAAAGSRATSGSASTSAANQRAPHRGRTPPGAPAARAARARRGRDDRERREGAGGQARQCERQADDDRRRLGRAMSVSAATATAPTCVPTRTDRRRAAARQLGAEDRRPRHGWAISTRKSGLVREQRVADEDNGNGDHPHRHAHEKRVVGDERALLARRRAASMAVLRHKDARSSRPRPIASGDAAEQQRA